MEPWKILNMTWMSTGEFTARSLEAAGMLSIEK
jgi:hypothetical protein